MPDLRGLTIIVATADAERFDAALTLASAHAALGGRTRLYCHDRAVGLLIGSAPLLATAREIGVALVACQTGLANAGIAHDSLPPATEAGGMVGILAALDDDRLVVI